MGLLMNKEALEQVFLPALLFYCANYRHSITPNSFLYKMVAVEAAFT